MLDLLLPAEGGSSAAGDGPARSEAPGRTRRWLRLGQSLPVASWPRAQAPAVATAPVAVRYGSEERPGRGALGRGGRGEAVGSRGWS